MRKLLLLLVLVSQSAFGAYTFIQRGHICCSNPNVIVMPGATTTGSLLVVGASIVQEPVHHVVSIAGGGVTTWVKAASSNVTTDLEVWYGIVASGSSTAITVTFDAAPHIAQSWAMEFSESSGTPGGVDQTSTSTSSGSPISSGSVTTSAAADLVIAVVARGSGGSNYTGGPSDSFIRTPNNSTSDFIQVAYQIETATGTFSTSWTYASGNADGVIVAFLPAETSGTTFVPSNIY